MIVGGILMVRSFSPHLVVGVALSVTRTLKLSVPPVVGVPLIAPAVDSDNPAVGNGFVPVMDQV